MPRLPNNEVLTNQDWFLLPLSLRKRYWEETKYGAKDPSEELKKVLREALARPWNEKD